MSDLHILALAMMLTPVGVAAFWGCVWILAHLIIVGLFVIKEPRSTYRVDDWLNPGSTRRRKSST